MLQTFAEALNYLYGNLPMFQKVGTAAYKKDLTNALALCNVLGNPQDKLRTIHVAGTNGKGSTSHMMASILQSAGYKTGLYTSPHLKSFTERIRVNGQEIEQQFVVDFTNRMMAECEAIKPSFFEITVAMAFDYFVKQQVDVAVIEVGLGGRLDSTNIINPILSLITNIGYDHMDILGNTLPEIAFEKAGIIKQNVPVVITERQTEVERVFKDTAALRNAPLVFAGDHWHCQWNSNATLRVSRGKDIIWDSMTTALKGNYQLKNIPGVLMSIQILNDLGWKIEQHHISEGIEHTTELTGLKGRWQVLSHQPLIICDTAHNESGVREVMSQLITLPHKQLYIIWGMVKDKDRKDILALLPKSANYYFCQASIPRALNAFKLAEEASAIGLSGKVVPDVNEALAQAKIVAGTEDIIFTGGSTFIVAELDIL
ncbi:MAG: bifunctional folylpolyglutamate synthase/dihydrofolate synthase [Cyclobacteriaceae bacterium]|jgi:dihydrofolate synthase/folylpolyglutamate synthase|nr:bifunctional folylpolyglutamate synthase/dihydrofolate synthase [Cyclobacteriaceae bacterium]